MKITITKRSQSYLKLSVKSNETENPSPRNASQTIKLTHWPSRYKTGIQLIKHRKSRMPSIKIAPTLISFIKAPIFERPHKPQSPEIPKLKVYCKRPTTNSHYLHSTDESSWKDLPKPKLQLKLMGKSLNMSENRSESPQKTSKFFLKINSIGAKNIFSQHECKSSVSNVAPW